MSVDILVALHKIKDKALAGRGLSKSYGICNHLEDLVIVIPQWWWGSDIPTIEAKLNALIDKGVLLEELLHQAFESWEFFSGCIFYPVGGEEEYCWSTENNLIWKGEHLEARLLLLDHLIELAEEGFFNALTEEDDNV